VSAHGQDEIELARAMIALGSTQASFCVLSALAAPREDVIAIGEVSGALAAGAELARVRVRACAVEHVFDAIGEHTRALAVGEVSAEVLEALLELELPVIVLADSPPHDPGRGALVVITPTERPFVAVRCEGEAGRHAPEIARRLAALTPPELLAAARELLDRRDRA
jgi:hypothetical protein